MKQINNISFFPGYSLTFLLLVLLVGCDAPANNSNKAKPRVIISTDIGGTDPDDFQSVIHLLMYSDLFQVEGLISSPYGEGRTSDLLDMIDLYEADLPKLTVGSKAFPSPESLREVSKQGAIDAAPFKGWSTSTEGSEWIIKSAKKENNQPLWILVWGGLEDLAQALHDAPEIKNKIKVYWIGGPNKKWSVNSYSYIAKNHPDLYMIEANATYRGWFIDDESPEELKNDRYYDHYIRGLGNMGKAFKNYYGGEIKMGDTPSLTYVMNGDPNDPYGESWGGSFTKIDYSSRTLFNRNTTVQDTVPVYSVIEWRFKGPEIDIPQDSASFTMEISGQVWPGYYLGEGNYAIRYSPKSPDTWTYKISSNIPGFKEQTGQFVSTNPWPGKQGSDDYPLGTNWYGDRPDPDLFLGIQQGARTISRWRQEFLMDWADRWKLLE